MSRLKRARIEAEISDAQANRLIGLGVRADTTRTATSAIGDCAQFVIKPRRGAKVTLSHTLTTRIADAATNGIAHRDNAYLGSVFGDLQTVVRLRAVSAAINRTRSGTPTLHVELATRGRALGGAVFDAIVAVLDRTYAHVCIWREAEDALTLYAERPCTAVGERTRRSSIRIERSGRVRAEHHTKSADRHRAPQRAAVTT